MVDPERELPPHLIRDLLVSDGELQSTDRSLERARRALEQSDQAEAKPFPGPRPTRDAIREIMREVDGAGGGTDAGGETSS